MTTATPSVRPAWVTELSASITGRVFVPGDPEYLARSTPWNVAVPCVPAGVVVAADAADVAAVVRAAAEHGLRVDVRATGHGAAPVGPDVLLVHTGDLDELVVHPRGWARVGAGVRWSAVLAAAAEHGFAPVCGSAPGVGVVGFLTGGGVGPLSRTYGLGSDHVRAFELVTGDGVLRRVTPDAEPELFRGLCGGKGSLGIVTAVEIDLLPLPSVYGGCLYFDGADTAAVLQAWRRWAPTLPAAATTSVAVLNLPPLPAVPPPLAGRCTVAVRYAWTGDEAAGEAAFAPMRDVAAVILGEVGHLPSERIGAIHADPEDPMPVTETAHLLADVETGTIDALLALVGPGAENPQVVVEVRQLGGAVATPSRHGDVVTHREAPFALLTIGIGVPPLVGPTTAHADALAAALGPWLAAGGLPNFGGALTAASARRCFGTERLAALAGLVAHHDPAGVLTGGDAVRSAAVGPAASV
ncbi:FAD-binding oxidoreductase [Jatrophihabitans fulvus]